MCQSPIGVYQDEHLQMKRKNAFRLWFGHAIIRLGQSSETEITSWLNVQDLLKFMKFGATQVL